MSWISPETVTPTYAGKNVAPHKQRMKDCASKWSRVATCQTKQTQQRGNRVRLDTEAMLASSLKMDWILHARG